MLSVRECSAISRLRKSENSARCLVKRMLYYFSIEKIGEFNEISRLIKYVIFSENISRVPIELCNLEFISFVQAIIIF